MDAKKETPPAATEGAKRTTHVSNEHSAIAGAVHDPLSNIPLELRERLQWVAATAGKVPINPRTGGAASVNDPSTWGTFEEARSSGQPHVGFVLTAFDPYVAIDIDDKQENPANDADRAAQRRALDGFRSYTERSTGARWIDAQGNERGGYHIILKGKMPDSGRDRGHIAVYGSRRFIVFTGDVVRQAPIEDEQPLLDTLLAQMPASASSTSLYK